MFENGIALGMAVTYTLQQGQSMGCKREKGLTENLHPSPQQKVRCCSFPILLGSLINLVRFSRSRKAGYDPTLQIAKTHNWHTDGLQICSTPTLKKLWMDYWLTMPQPVASITLCGQHFIHKRYRFPAHAVCGDVHTTDDNKFRKLVIIRAVDHD